MRTGARVGIVTDSAASLGGPLASEHHIVVVPMQLTVAGRAYQEDEVSLEQVVASLPEGVQTAGPAPGAFLAALERADEGSGVLIVTVAERLSSTIKAARIAADLAPGRVRVLDACTAAGAQGLVVLAAARAARAGLGLEDVARAAEQVASKVRLVAAVDSLDQLVRGGRLPEVAARAGRYLDLRALFELRSGRPRPLKPSRGDEAATEAIVGYVRRSRPPDGQLHVGALHALDEPAAEGLIRRVRAEVEPVESFLGTFGPVMVAHTGAGVRGLAWWWESPT